MKISFINIINIVFYIIIYINKSIYSIKIKQIPKINDLVPIDQYKQAPIPPNILIMEDIPQNGQKSLDKWNNYIEANLKLLDDYNKRYLIEKLNISTERNKRINKLLSKNISKKLK